jgi:hypothetical protein
MKQYLMITVLASILVVCIWFVLGADGQRLKRKPKDFATLPQSAASLGASPDGCSPESTAQRLNILSAGAWYFSSSNG